MPLHAVALPQAADTEVPAQAPTNAALGRAIRRLRKRRGLTIEDLALEARMHPTYLSSIERGERNPTWSKLCGLANTLGAPVSVIVGEAENEVSCPVCGGVQRQEGVGALRPPMALGRRVCF